jgi:hypothetical protein
MHYCRSYAGRCDACQLPILGKFIELTDKRIDKKWHPECHVIARDLGISLPLSTAGREYLESIERGALQGYVPPMQEQHEEFIMSIYQTAGNFVTVSQDSLTLTLEGCRGAEGFENWKIMLSLPSRLLEAASKATHNIGEFKHSYYESKTSY